MNREVITIENGKVSVPENVSMRAFEIADLFGVYVQTVNVNIKAIIKSGVVSPDTTGQVIANGRAVIPLNFGLDMVIALSFRINSRNAQVFREWLIKKAVANPTEKPIVMIGYRNRYSIN